MGKCVKSTAGEKNPRRRDYGAPEPLVRDLVCPAARERVSLCDRSKGVFLKGGRKSRAKEQGKQQTVAAPARLWENATSDSRDKQAKAGMRAGDTRGGPRSQGIAARRKKKGRNIGRAKAVWPHEGPKTRGRRPMGNHPPPKETNDKNGAHACCRGSPIVEGGVESHAKSNYAEIILYLQQGKPAHQRDANYCVAPCDRRTVFELSSHKDAEKKARIERGRSSRWASRRFDRWRSLLTEKRGDLPRGIDVKKDVQEKDVPTRDRVEEVEVVVLEKREIQRGNPEANLHKEKAKL